MGGVHGDTGREVGRGDGTGYLELEQRLLVLLLSLLLLLLPLERVGPSLLGLQTVGRVAVS
jgi:hypothetical protein